VQVFRIRPDVNRWGYLVPAPGESAAGDELVFDGSSRAWSWRPLHLGLRPPGREPPDFAKLGHGAFVLREAARKLTQPVLERCGELLEVHLLDDTLSNHQVAHLANVTKVADCLDPEATEWVEVQGRRVHVKTYAFRPEALPDVAVFKVRGLERDRVFTVSQRGPRERDFKLLVEGAGLKGLVFELVWEG
jgi:hypothetical protein